MRMMRHFFGRSFSLSRHLWKQIDRMNWMIQRGPCCSLATDLMQAVPYHHQNPCAKPKGFSSLIPHPSYPFPVASVSNLPTALTLRPPHIIHPPDLPTASISATPIPSSSTSTSTTTAPPVEVPTARPPHVPVADIERRNLGCGVGVKLLHPHLSATYLSRFSGALALMVGKG